MGCKKCAEEVCECETKYAESQTFGYDKESYNKAKKEVMAHYGDEGWEDEEYEEAIERRLDGYCIECSDTQHDSCGMVSRDEGCSCCDNTKDSLNEHGMDAESQTFEAMRRLAPSSRDVQTARRYLKNSGYGEVIYDRYLVNRAGSSNKYYYTSITEKDGKYYPMGAYGRIGALSALFNIKGKKGSPKASCSSMEEAYRYVKEKERSKVNKKGDKAYTDYTLQMAESFEADDRHSRPCGNPNCSKPCYPKATGSMSVTGWPVVRFPSLCEECLIEFSPKSDSGEVYALKRALKAYKWTLEDCLDGRYGRDDGEAVTGELEDEHHIVRFLNAESFEANEDCEHCHGEGWVRWGKKDDQIETCASCYPEGAESFGAESDTYGQYTLPLVGRQREVLIDRIAGHQIVALQNAMNRGNTDFLYDIFQKGSCPPALNDMTDEELLREWSYFSAESFEANGVVGSPSPTFDEGITGQDGPETEPTNATMKADSLAEIEGPTEEATAGGLHSPSSFAMTWEDGTGYSSASIPPNEIAWAEGKDENVVVKAVKTPIGAVFVGTALALLGYSVITGGNLLKDLGDGAKSAVSSAAENRRKGCRNCDKTVRKDSEYSVGQINPVEVEGQTDVHGAEQVSYADPYTGPTAIPEYTNRPSLKMW